MDVQDFEYVDVSIKIEDGDSHNEIEENIVRHVDKFAQNIIGIKEELTENNSCAVEDVEAETKVGILNQFKIETDHNSDEIEGSNNTKDTFRREATQPGTSSENKPSSPNRAVPMRGLYSHKSTDKLTVSCPFCEMSLHHEVNMRNHIKIVHEKPKRRRHKCGICEKSFNTKIYLDKHIKSHNWDRDKGAHICNICGVLFHRKENLKVHQRFHKDNEHFQCDICKINFNIKKAFIQHAHGFHGGYQDSDKAGTDEMNSIKMAESECEPILVDELNKTNEDNNSEQGRNVDQKQGSPCWQCGECGKIFSKKSKHNHNNEIKKEHFCYLCESKFKNAFDLVYHHKITHFNKITRL